MDITGKSHDELRNIFAALSGAQAIIVFNSQGTILEANAVFCRTMGYREDEIIGKHHRMFVRPEDARSAEYRAFWGRLARGEAQVSNFIRVHKDGRHVYLEASYTALRNSDGAVDKVIKIASDVSKRETARNALLSSVSDAARIISEEAAAITGTAGDLSKRSENQAATVEETSAAMEEISQTVNSNAQNAEQATEQAKSARQKAEKGGEVVERAIAAMTKIESGSKEIRKFIEVIDSIAFQTNLLALNAGVEAARAGDAGRGFAVVASEVRALAQRASESAKDINALIDSSTRQVEEGARLVNETGTVLSDITEGVSRVAEGIEAIFTASREQASGVHEINQSIGNIDKDTQRNATMAQESAASAQALARAAADLMSAVAQVGHASPSGAPLPGQPPRTVEGSPQRVAAMPFGSSPRPAPSAPMAPVRPARSPEIASPPPNPRFAVNGGVAFDDDDGAWTEF